MRTGHLWLCVGVAVIFFACDRNVTHVEEIAGPAGCTDCHNSTDVITAKQTQWAESVHATGTAVEDGTSASCAFCHSGSAFSAAVAAGLAPNELTEGDPNPTHQDCRACHQIHETFTAQDWALETSAPVSFYAIPGTTFDGGEGNLCVNCHQPRRNAPVAVDGVISGITSRYGPHHGPQSAMILGVGGAGVTGTPSGHYGAVENTCVQCHMGDERNHTFEPNVETCQQCHPDATDFDVNGRQTEILALADQLGQLLVDAGLIDQNSMNGRPIVTSATEDQGIAMWNWIYVHHEDRSFGVHNYEYARELLVDGITRMGGTPAVAMAHTR